MHDKLTLPRDKKVMFLTICRYMPSVCSVVKLALAFSLNPIIFANSQKHLRKSNKLQANYFTIFLNFRWKKSTAWKEIREVVKSLVLHLGIYICDSQQEIILHIINWWTNCTILLALCKIKYLYKNNIYVLIKHLTIQNIMFCREIRPAGWLKKNIILRITTSLHMWWEI